MESMPVSGKDGTEGSSQDNLLHAAKPLDEENEGGSSSSLDDWFQEILEGGPRRICLWRRASYDRIPEPRKSLEIQVEAPITNQYVPGRNVVIIRPRATSNQVNPQGHDNLVLEEDDEEIVEEKAICKICFDEFKEENTLKTVCRCKNALIHEECAAKWLREKGNNNCDFCGEKVENFPVTLLRGLSFTRRADAKERNKNSWFSCLTM